MVNTDYMSMDGRPLKRPLIWNFVVSSEVVKKNVQKIRPPIFVVFCALSNLCRLFSMMIIKDQHDSGELASIGGSEYIDSLQV